MIRQDPIPWEVIGRLQSIFFIIRGAVPPSPIESFNAIEVCVDHFVDDYWNVLRFVWYARTCDCVKLVICSVSFGGGIPPIDVARAFRRRGRKHGALSGLFYVREDGRRRTGRSRLNNCQRRKRKRIR